VALQPLVDRMREAMLTLPALHADETPVGMLEIGTGKTQSQLPFRLPQWHRTTNHRVRLLHQLGLCDFVWMTSIFQAAMRAHREITAGRGGL
jgi:hypothetical protein